VNNTFGYKNDFQYGPQTFITTFEVMFSLNKTTEYLIETMTIVIYFFCLMLYV